MSTLPKPINTLLNSLIVIFIMVTTMLFIFLSLPVYFYFWAIKKADMLFNQKYEEQLGNIAQIMASEIRSSEQMFPRSSVVASLVIHGHIKLDELYETVKTNGIHAVDQHGNLKYPQLQQFPESRMGYMFWKQDENFELSNHLKLHILDENGSDNDSETFLERTCEQLLNQRYSRNKSPWEIHLVHNYKNSKLLDEARMNEGDSTDLTLMIIRIHHSLGDGYGFLSFVMDLFNANKGSMCNLAQLPTHKNWTALGTATFYIKLFVKSLYEWGRLISFHFKPATIYHAIDSRKKGSQHYSRAVSIPIQKIKAIKNRFGVKFGTVINSCFAAALGKMAVKMTDSQDVPQSMVLANILPKPNHPLTFTIHAYMTLHEIPTRAYLNPVDRLLRCEASAREVNNSPQSKLIEFLLTSYAGHISHIAKYLAKNRSNAVGITNFRGPETHLKWNGRKCLAFDFSTGGHDGVCGIVLSVFGYAGRVQICATAEKGIISERNLKELLEQITDEIETLYSLRELSE